jgi:hypothetical protein
MAALIALFFTNETFPNPSHDCHTSMLVVANTIEDARTFAAKNCADEGGYTWERPEETVWAILGEASPALEYGVVMTGSDFLHSQFYSVDNLQTYKARIMALAEALEAQPKTIVHEVTSKLYEKMTGKALHRSSDPVNGENFLYLSSDDDCIASLALHEEVVQFFFGWNNRMMRVGALGEPELAIRSTEAPLVARALRSSWESMLLEMGGV